MKGISVIKVGIIGTGMTALVAAQAVTNFDPMSQVTIYGPNEKPVAAGARWYERNIPGVEVMSRMCKTMSIGDPEHYADKLGNPVSLYFRARNNFLAYNFHDAHEFLWEKFRHNTLEISPEYDLINDSDWSSFDYVINTSPRPNFFEKSGHHLFAATRHWRIDENSGTTNPYATPGNHDKNLMIFDSSKDSSWFRMTQLFGLISVEFPYAKRPPIDGLSLEILPLGMAGKIALDQIESGWRGAKALLHVGASARWEPSTDVGEVYAQVTEFFDPEEEDEWDDADSRGYL